MQRNPAIDILRGVLLLLMTMSHLPTVWSASLGEPLGFISAAEGFVFLSAFLAGKLFQVRQEREGPRAATRWMLGRALQLYLLHLALLVLAFTVVAWIGTTFERPAVRNLLDFYFQAPGTAVVSSAMLFYEPPLLDILPMYVLFLLCTPLVMRIASRWGWRWVLAPSALLWVAARFGLRALVYSYLHGVAGSEMPSTGGSFDLFAWQLLWVLGLWFGALGFGRTREAIASGGGLLTVALAVSFAMFAWRHYSGPMGFSDMPHHLFWIDKWTLSPVRIINFAALLCVGIGFGKNLAQRVRMPPLEAIGRASQWVFVAHIASALLLLCLVGRDDQPLGGARGLLVVLAGYLVLFITAAVHQSVRRMRKSQMSAVRS